uniref:Uncharacterized protein n=1 Tax=Rangifer tarandus platyrhynchus TaxID=3082113 RepID=A0ACB0ECD0_RANTA|nr:unnamed protein product [Rangifer tarandus platyrhynchus]
MASLPSQASTSTSSPTNSRCLIRSSSYMTFFLYPNQGSQTRHPCSSKKVRKVSIHKLWVYLFKDISIQNNLGLLGPIEGSHKIAFHKICVFAFFYNPNTCIINHLRQLPRCYIVTASVFIHPTTHVRIHAKIKSSDLYLSFIDTIWYLNRFSGKLEQIELRNSFEDRQGRRHCSREAAIRQTLERERRQYQAHGLALSEEECAGGEERALAGPAKPTGSGQPKGCSRPASSVRLA